MEIDLAIDVGGTNTDIYFFDIKLKVYKLIRSYETPKKPIGLINFLTEIISEFKPKKLLLGIPGPVDTRNDKNVYCPPLGYCISYKEIFDINPKLKVLILNDVGILAYIHERSLKFNLLNTNEELNKLNPNIFITLGTSFGFSYLLYSRENRLTNVKSLELAHVPLIVSDYFFEEFKSINIFNGFHRLTYGDVLSAKGFAWCKNSINQLACDDIKLLNKYSFKLNPNNLFTFIFIELLIPIIRFSAPDNKVIFLHGGLLNALSPNFNLLMSDVLKRENITSLRICSSRNL